ncbi:hypothetical protein Pcinc_031258 [Petrolisthes cinctipes]|uniref:Thioredoxin domain-containing protein n=1 Tax=Petrolisthes cinctipes TaxID=88211 RepID=A0AAE1EWF9_PETCI|nr:hypothetical protein Pcinc_031258 [Petrolisthes cinctipes]
MTTLISYIVRTSTKLDKRCIIPLLLQSPPPPQLLLLSPLRTFSSEVPKSQPPQKKRPARGKGPVTWKSLAVTGVIGASLLAFMLYVRKEKEAAQARERKRALGKASIGGRFELIDHNGTPRTSDDFLGRWVLLYFGFTHCPDVCPDELEKMAKVVDDVEKLECGQSIQPLFITVDPKRDSQAAIKQYCAEFHPRLLGLTGSEDAIAQACRAYRVYFSAGPRDEDDDYIVDHTIILYLVNPDGDFVDYFGQNKTAEQATASIVFSMKKFDDANKKGFLGSLL